MSARRPKTGMLMAWPAWTVATLLALCAPIAAWACSPVSGYVRPSNFELVQIAEAIVVATPIGQGSGGDDLFGHKVRFRVTQTLKGQVADEIEVQRLALGRTRPSDPNDIVFSHPEGHMGPCNRVTLTKGGSYVLFLRQNGEAYAPLGYPFSRVSEDYAGESALWPRTIRTYLRLQNAETPMAQVATLEAMRAEIAAKTLPSRDEQALAFDIEQHLGALSPWKPTPFLLAALDDLKAGRPSRYALRHPAFDGEQSDAAAFTAQIMQELGAPDETPAPPRRDPRQTAVLEMLIDGEHPAAMPLFEVFAAPDAPADDWILAIRFYARNGRYAEAYDMLEARAQTLVSSAPEAEARRVLYAIGDVQEDLYGRQDQPRWKDDPAIAARWPVLALSLHRIEQARFGESGSFIETLTGVLGTDYRANPELTYDLSGHDRSITEWAKRELVQPERLAQSTGGPDDLLRLPIRITVHWMGLRGSEEADTLAPAFCLGAPQRRMIFEEWGKFGGDASVNAVLRLAATPLVDDVDLQLLATAIPTWDQRHVADRGESLLAKDDTLRKLVAGQTLTAKDIKPLKPVACPR